jgi:hypothetical protein
MLNLRKTASKVKPRAWQAAEEVRSIATTALRKQWGKEIFPNHLEG